MGGTGSKQEDQIITAAIEQATGAKLTYVPYKGGGDVAAQLVGGHINSSVNNPIEAVAQWRAGELGRSACSTPSAWPTRSDRGRQGVVGRPDLHGIRPADRVSNDARHLHRAGGHEDQVAFYVDLLKRVRGTPRMAGVHGARRLQARPTRPATSSRPGSPPPMTCTRA